MPIIRDGQVVGSPVASGEAGPGRAEGRSPSRPAFRPSGRNLEEIRSVTQGPPAPSLFEQATSIVRAAPAGLAGFVGDVARAPWQLGTQAGQAAFGVGDGEFNLSAIEAAEDVRESFAGTIHRVTNPTEYLRAIDEGRILGTLVEDVGNVALVGGSAARALGAGSRAAGAGLRGAASEGGERAVRQIEARSRARRAADPSAPAVTYQDLAAVAGRGQGRAAVADSLAGASNRLRQASRLTNEAADIPFLPYRAAVSGARRVIPERVRQGVAQSARGAVAPITQRTNFDPNIRATNEALVTAEALAEGAVQRSTEPMLRALDDIDVDQVRADGYGADLDDGQLRRAVASASMYQRVGDAGQILPLFNVYARRQFGREWVDLDVDSKRQIVDRWRSGDGETPGPGVAIAERNMDIGLPEGQGVPSEAFVLAVDRAVEATPTTTAAQLSRFELTGILPSQRAVREAYLGREVGDGSFADAPSTMDQEAPFQPDVDVLEGEARDAKYQRRRELDATVGARRDLVDADPDLAELREQIDELEQRANTVDQDVAPEQVAADRQRLAEARVFADQRRAILEEDVANASPRLMPAVQRVESIRGDVQAQSQRVQRELDKMLQKGSDLSEAEVAALREQSEVFDELAAEIRTGITAIREQGERQWQPGERDLLLDILDPDTPIPQDLESFGFMQSGDPRMLGTDLVESAGMFESVGSARRSGQQFARDAQAGPQARTPEGVLRLMERRVRETRRNDVRHYLEQTVGVPAEVALGRSLSGERVDLSAINDDAGRGVALNELGWAPLDMRNQSVALDDVVVPRNVATTFAEYTKQADEASQFLDGVDALNLRVKGTWLPMSPSWYIGNAVGGTMMGSAEVGFLNYMRALPDALASMQEFLGEDQVPRGMRGLSRRALNRRERRADRMSESPDVELRDVMGDRAYVPIRGEDLPPRVLRRGMGDLTYETLRGTETDRRLRRMGVTEASGGRVRRGVRAVDDRVAGFVQGAYRVNNYFDDLARVATFVAARAQPTRGGRLGRGDVTFDNGSVRLRGPDVEEATNRALRATGDFQMMTPFERRAMRRVFAFYPWYKHVTKLFFSLPVNHPSRVAWTFHLGQVFGPAGEDEVGLGSSMPFWLGGTFEVGSGRMRVPGIPFVGPEDLPLVAFDTQDSGLGAVDFRPLARALSPAITWPTAVLTGFDMGELSGLSSSPGSEDTVVGDFFLNQDLTSLLDRPDALAYWISNQMPLTRSAQRAGVFDALDILPGFGELPGTRNLVGDPNLARYDTGEPVMTGTGPIRLERPGSLRQGLDFITGGLTRVLPDQDEQLQARRAEALQSRRDAQRRYLTRRENADT